MIKATPDDKPHIVDLLTESFKDNKSVNYIIRQDESKYERLQALMAYSFDVCNLFGAVYLSQDRNACALILYPDRRRNSLAAIWLDIKLIFTAIGFKGIVKALKRESAIKALQPKIPMSYLWFIGVAPAAQHQGKGSKLLNEIMTMAKTESRPVYLETSTEDNLPWYAGLGFENYDRLDLGYILYFLKQINS